MNSDYYRDDILQGLYEIMQRMRAHAHNNEWEEVSSCNRLRLRLSEHLRPVKNNNDPDEKQIIDELYQIDVEVIALAEKLRDTTASDMKNINGSKSKVNQYLQNQFG